MRALRSVTRRRSSVISVTRGPTSVSPAAAVAAEAITEPLRDEERVAVIRSIPRPSVRPPLALANLAGRGITALVPRELVVAMLLHLADKFKAFIPQDLAGRTECLCWLMWQMGSAPFIGGGYGHFYHYAPVKIEYAINRYAMETKRLFDVANNRLKETRFLAGEDYSIADIAAFTWLGNLYTGLAYGNTREFLQLEQYEAVGRWVGEIAARPAVQRGRVVNTQRMPERHSAADFEGVELVV